MDSPLVKLNKIRKDEYYISFENTTAFTVRRYQDIVEAISDGLLSDNDRKIITESRDFQTIQEEMQNKRLDPTISSHSRRLLNQLQPLPRTLNDLERFFQHAVHPEKLPMESLWGLLYLNFMLSYDSPEKLKITADWMGSLRRVIEIFNRCLESCKDTDINEARLAVVEVFDPLLSAFSDSIKFLRDSKTDLELKRTLPTFKEQISMHIMDIDRTVKHLSEITKFASVNRERIQRNIVAREAADGALEEAAIFPIQMLPYPRNPKFYGRQIELKKINQALSWRIPENDLLRAYTIYGRRGVGKTEIALEYAYLNPEKFDAIFWVNCETSLSLRESFTSIAKAVNIPGADKSGTNHDEDNHLAVQQWLKRTRCRWLMIFDNAEKDDLLKTYWPLGAGGAILITSRTYRNFFKDDRRKGDTIQPFPPDQSFQLLCNYLGNHGRDLQQWTPVKTAELTAAEEFLHRLEGLPLAISLAARLIQNKEIGGVAIESTFELFKKHSMELPGRYLGKRSDTYRSLDALWDMVFQTLSENAGDLLKVLSFLSPDTIYVDLFLPHHQACLDGKLSFCKQDFRQVGDDQVTLVDIRCLALIDHEQVTPVDGDQQALADNKQSDVIGTATPTQALEDALAALSRAQLIERHDGTLRVRHEIQEAINHPNLEDLQDSFNAAVRLVGETFSKRHFGIPLFEQWATCSRYIHHGVRLAMNFADYNRFSRLKGTDELVVLIGNCAWYLYEISSYDKALQIIEVGYHACSDKESLQYADLCNTAGICYLEKNFLNPCRAVLEISLSIREAKLSPNDIDIAASTHNLGNLETALGNYNKAMEYFDRSLKILLANGDTAENQLALLYLRIGQVQTLKREFDEARRTFAKAEHLFIQTVGEEDHFMAHVHHAYGNVEYRSSNWPSARFHYINALRIAIVTNPIHPITAAAYISLGSVEYKLKNLERAKSHLEKALAIAELRSPTRDDGTVARILYVLSRVMSENPLTAGEAEDLRVRAENARNILLQAGESALVDAYEQDGELDFAQESYLYDALVPIFFR